MKERITIKDLLKPEIIEICNDLSNYSTDYDSSKKLICQSCKSEIEDPLQLILWNEDREHYISFHFKFVVNSECVDLFNEIAGRFDYTYGINNNKHISCR